jgi:hypothetical protein
MVGGIARGPAADPGAEPKRCRVQFPGGEVPRAIPVDETVGTEVRVSYSPLLQPFSTSERRTTRTTDEARTGDIVGSNAAGSRKRGGGLVRWPAGTVFRLLSTGQVYRGITAGALRAIHRPYMNQREMNSWGAREEGIQTCNNDPQQSLQFLQSHRTKHIKRWCSS